MKLFIILFVFGIFQLIYCEQKNKDFYDLNDSTEHVYVVQLILKKLGDLSKVTSKIDAKMEDINKRYLEVENKFSEVENKFNLISQQFDNFKTVVLEQNQKNEQRFEVSGKIFAALNERVNEINELLEKSDSNILTFKNETSNILNNQTKALEKMEIETHQDHKRIDDLETLLNLTRKENSIFRSDVSQTIGEQNDAFRTELNRTVADINKLIGNSSNECLEFKTEITKTLKEQKSTLEHLQNKANQDQKSISELKSRLDVSVKDYSTFKTDISKTVKQYNDAFKKDLNNRIADINKLLSKSANEVLAFKNEIAKTLNEHKVNLNRLENNTLEYQKRQETQMKNLWENGSLDKKSDWTIVLRREDGSVNFNRNWADYKAGFGNLNSEFFIGMEALHNLTSNGSPHEMVITLKDFNGVQTFARYDDIVIGSEKEQYELKVLGVHSGNADDSLRHHEGEKFTTRDRDNDNSPKTNCAETFKGPWWYYQCNPSSQLFGPYEGQAHGQRLRWSLNKLHDLKYVEVKIKN